MKIGDLVKIMPEHTDNNQNELSWVGMVVRRSEIGNYIEENDTYDDEWEVHWFHYPPHTTSFEYGYYLEVISESR